MSRVTPLPHDSSLSQPQSGDPWYIEHLSDSPLDIGVWLNPAQLQNIFSGAEGLLTRDSPTDHHIFLCDYYNESLSLSAWLVPATKPDHYHIHVNAKLSAPFPEAVVVCLRWNGQEYRQHLSAGEVLFEDLTAPEFKSKPTKAPTPEFKFWFELDGQRR